MIATQWKSY